MARRKMGAGYRGWHLSSFKGNAAACFYRDGTRVHRFDLHVPADSAGAYEILVAFANAWDRQTVVATNTVEALVAMYLREKESEGKSVECFRSRWKRLAPMFAGLTPDKVNGELCKAYAVMRETRGKMGRGVVDSTVRLGELSPSTIWAELSFLRMALTWCWKNRLVNDKPVVWLPKKGVARSLVIAPEKVSELLDYLAARPHLAHVRLYVVLLMLSGVRAAAARELQWSRVDFEKGQIDFREHAQRVNILEKRAQKPRPLVHMGPALRALLTQAREVAKTEFVLEHSGRPLSRQLNTTFRKVCDAVGLPKVTAHTFRHTVVTYLVAQGYSHADAAKQVGHQDSRTTAGVYDHSTATLSTAEALESGFIPRLRTVK